MSIALFYVLAIASVCWGQNLIGTYQLPSNSLHLISGIKTQFRVEESVTAIYPALQVRASFSGSLSDVLVQGSNGEITLRLPPDLLESTASNSTWNLFLVTFVSLVCLSGFRKTISIWGCFAFLIAAIWAQGSNEFQVTLEYPPNYSFAQIKLELEDGDFTSSGQVSVNSFDVIYKNTASSFTADNVTVGSQLQIDIGGSISITNLVHTTATGNITSRNGDVELGFRRGFEFQGPLSVTYGGALVIPGNCTLNGNNGFCFTSISSSSLVIRSAGDITIRWAPLDCNAYATTDVVLPFPSINSTFLQGYSWTFDDYRLWESSASGSTVLPVLSDSNGNVVINRTTGNPIWAIYMTEGVVLPIALHPSRTYRISFDYFQDPNSAANNTLNMTVRVWKLSEFGEPSSNNSRIIAWPPSTDMTPRGTLVTQSVQYDRVPTSSTPITFDFSPNALATRAYFGFFFHDRISFGFQI